MWSVGFTVFILGLYVGFGSCQYLNHRPFPTYSLENMPDTGFTCRDKILGGYYADSETQCQMFHICVKVAGVGVQDFRFLCPNGTAFDQDHQICAEWEDVDCDATTLYYASDNFDLYRIGSGFESKAVKYGEDEETFSLQRAETGDARLNREHQAARVNQQKDYNKHFQTQNRNYNNNNNNNKQNNNNNDREIFRSSSSSNFFNNRNGGKEVEEDDEDDNVNVNQNRDREQKRKIVRKQQRRPANNNSNNQNQNYDTQTNKPTRPTGFSNNFAGSSYVPTTSRPTTAQNNEQQLRQNNNNQKLNNNQPAENNQQYNNNNQQFNNRGKVQHRQRVNNERQYNNADDFRQTGRNYDNTNKQTPPYTVSTPAPFRQTQQYTNNQNKQSTTPVPIVTNNRQQSTKQTENYPSTFAQTNKQPTQTKQTENYPTTSAFTKNTQYNNDYEVSKTKQTKQTENYPTNTFETKKATTPFKQTENYPSTLNSKAANTKTTQYNTQKTDNYPTTFAPRTNVAYTQISQQSSQLNTKQTQKYNTNPQSSSTQYNNNSPSTQYNNNNNSPSTQYNNAPSSNNNNNTPRTSPFTQYTPTVPKITTPYYSSTTPVSRSNKFDETQYDDGSYNSKYENYDNKGQDDEFLKAAHSTNIANSRNEYTQNAKNFVSSTQKPRPFSISPNTPKSTDNTRVTQNSKTTQNFKSTQSSTNQNKPLENANNNKKPEYKTPGKNEKNASYDYAYYDTSVGSEPEYDIDAEFGKSHKVDKKQ